MSDSDIKPLPTYKTGDQLLVRCWVVSSGHDDSIFVKFKTESETAQLRVQDVVQCELQKFKPGDEAEYFEGESWHVCTIKAIDYTLEKPQAWIQPTHQWVTRNIQVDGLRRVKR